MLTAVQDFFPESGLPEQESGGDQTASASRPSGTYPLHRVNTGISSLVGNNNGDRPGGFVLVIDGGALNDVRVPPSFCGYILIGPLTRL